MNKGQNGNLMILFAGIIFLSFICMFTQQEELTKEDFLRFHVVANSNSYEDQKLKLRVRDGVLKEIAPVLAEMDSAESSRSWVLKNEERINGIAERVLEEAGSDYGSVTELGMRWIPQKSYGSVTLPAGNYEAFTIEIGEAKGENWWCVMFPPLCIIGEDPSKEEKELLQDQFSGTKYQDIIDSGLDGKPYVLKFKTVELSKTLF